MIELGDNCIACGSDQIRARHIVPEAMYRTGESFTYRECDVCSTLQIEKVPADLGNYYNLDSYYSFAAPDHKLQRRWLRMPPMRLAMRLNTELYLRTGFGKGLPWARMAGICPDDRILDIGCGGGTLCSCFICWATGTFSVLTRFSMQLGNCCQGFPCSKRHTRNSMAALIG